MRRAILAIVLFLAGITCLKVHADDLPLLGVSNSKTPTTGITLIQHAVHQNAGSGSTVAATLSGTTAGHFIVVGIFSCSTSCSTGGTITTSTVTSSAGETCSQVPGALQTGSTATGVYSDIWYCPNIVGGSDTITVTSSSGNFMLVGISEWSGVLTVSPLQTSSGNMGGGTGTVGNITTGTSTTQSGELIYSINVSGSAATPSSSQTTINSINGGPLDVYQISTSLATYTNTITFSTSAQVTTSIAAFKHP